MGPVQGPARWASGFGARPAVGRRPGPGRVASSATTPSAGSETLAAVTKSLQLPLLCLE